MEFCCPNCGREEQIIGDLHPRCLKCRVEMLPASNYSEVWMSPYIALRRMATISETYGEERARVSRSFKQDREAWSTGVLALALAKVTGEELWIEIETVDGTPDTKLCQIDQTSGYNAVQSRYIEVTDWEEHTGEIIEVIKKKCARAYPSDYLLVVHAHHTDKLLCLDQTIEEMRTVASPFLEVWIVARVIPDRLVAARVAPGGPTIEFLPAELPAASKQRPFLKRGIRGTDRGFRELGLVFLPIPRDE